MTLQQLKTYLDDAKTGTNIQMVLFDFLFYANLKNKAKEYPLVIWDIDNLTGNKDIRAKATDSRLNIDMYCLNLVTPEDDKGEAKLPVWDQIEADMQTYLRKVGALEFVEIPEFTVNFEYYPAGMLSMEREMGVLYRQIPLKLWC